MKEVQQIIDKNKEAVIIPDGIAVIGKDMKIIVFNEAASRVSGYDEDDIIGVDCTLLFRECAYDMKYISESLSNNRVFTNLAINITDKKGNVKNVLASITPITKEDSVLSVVFVFRDTKEMLS